MSTDLAVIEAALKAATPGPWDEEWRQVPGQDLYEVSDHGNVRSWRAQTRKAGGALRAETPHLMAAHNSRRDGKGYLSVGLPRPGGGYATHPIHRLVMAAFVGPRPPGLEIAHLNGNPRDNRLVNLRYVTHAENESHKLTHGTRASGEQVNGSRLLGWQVAEIRYLASKGVTQAKIANLFDMTSSHVSNIITGRIWPETVERDTATPAWLAELVERVKVAEARAAGEVKFRADVIDALLDALGITDDTTEADAKRILGGCDCNGEEGTLHLIWHLKRTVEHTAAAIERGRALADRFKAGGFTSVYESAQELGEMIADALDGDA